MNDGVMDAIRHNTWATRKLLDACKDLTTEQLNAEVVGGFGTIDATLNHYINSEGGYQARLMGSQPSWNIRDYTRVSVAELSKRVDELEARWEEFLSEPFDAERIFIYDWINDEKRAVPAGVVLAQAIHHGSEHRSQVATILTSIGITPPEWGLWEFAEETDRAPLHQA